MSNIVIPVSAKNRATLATLDAGIARLQSQKDAITTALIDASPDAPQDMSGWTPFYNGEVFTLVSKVPVPDAPLALVPDSDQPAAPAAG